MRNRTMPFAICTTRPAVLARDSRARLIKSPPHVQSLQKMSTCMGCKGRKFESCHSDHFKIKYLFNTYENKLAREGCAATKLLAAATRRNPPLSKAVFLGLWRVCGKFPQQADCRAGIEVLYLDFQIHDAVS
jgi:hypothetical protein